MTTLQEAVEKFIEATKLDRIEFEDWPRDSQTAFETLRAALAQQGQEPEIEMIDAAMVEMANIHPPLKRSECQRLIRAALSAAPAPQAQGETK